MGRNNGGRNFKPGVSGNPNGRPKVPPDVMEARNLNQHELERIFNRLLNLTSSDLTNEIRSGKLSTKEMAAARILEKAIVHGDHRRLDFILDRIIGKVTERVELKLPVPTIIERTNGTRVELGATYPSEEEEA